MQTNNVVTLQKVKWSIILRAGDNLGIFSTCLEKLVNSVDNKRVEIILLQDKENPVFLNIFSHLCEKANTPYYYGDNYAHAVNMSKGQYLVFITDHTFVSKNFLVKLTFCAENFDKEGKVAIVSPISNETVPSLNLNPENLDAVQLEISKQPKNQIPWAYTMNLPLFCMMVKKEVCESDDITPSKYLILNANQSGYYTVAANDTLVYHYNESLPLEWHSLPSSKKDQKLAVLYRLKIEDEYVKDVFVKSLEKSLQFADNVYVLDDNSKVKVGLFLREKHPDLWSKITKYEKFSRPYDERRDLNELIEWAEKDGCDWYFTLEGDEIVEDKVTKEYLSRLLSPNNPEIMGYKVSHYHFWDDEINYRIDPPWGKISDVRLARLVPERKIVKTGEVAAQFGYTVHFPTECIKDSSIRVKNYGYMTKEARQTKKEAFQKLNIKVNNQLVSDWDYLTSYKNITVYPWVENSTVTFYTPVNKGGVLLFNWLEQNSYFADELVVGNDSNQLTDVSLNLCKRYPNVKVVPITMNDNFAEGRNQCLESCSSNYIFQLDIDERIDDFMALRRMLDMPNADCWMFTIPNLQKDGKSIITETIRLFKNKDDVKYWGRLHETIDQHVKKVGWRISKSPIKLVHFGYTLQSDDEAYKKMQRYLGINLQQMKENPTYGMGYYNVALHLLEDNCVDDAIKLLELCNAFQPGFALGSIELGKCYIRKALQAITTGIKTLDPNHPIVEAFNPIKESLEKIAPKQYLVAPGHCLNYFSTHKEDANWLREHVLSFEKRVEDMRTKQLEQMAKK